MYEAFSGGRQAIDAITEAYVLVHYGQVPDTRAEMQQIVNHWRQLQPLVILQETQEEQNQ